MTKPGETYLTIIAAEYAPELKFLTINPDMEPLKIHLEPGGVIRGNVTDRNKKPIEGASIYASRWKGERQRLHLEVKTDTNGDFEIKNAPVDEVLFDIFKQEYMALENYPMQPDKDKYDIVLRPQLTVYGTVIDALTGLPIDRFSVTSGLEYEDGRAPSWQRYSTHTFTNGRYEMEFRQERFTYRLRVDADGYQSAISGSISPDQISETRFACDFKLDKPSTIEGLVLSPDGIPLSDAEVVITTHYLSIQNAQISSRSLENNQLLNTDSEGKFRFEQPITRYFIVVLHEKGYAKIEQSDFIASPAITVTPWGGIEGTLRIGNEPGVNKFVAFYSREERNEERPRIDLSYEVETDKNGRFIFPKVVPCRGSVTRAIPMERGRRYSHTTEVEVKPGQTVEVNLGGTGRAVTGKVIVPDYIKDKFSWQHTDSSLRIRSPGNPYKLISLTFNEDGTFHAEDVPAGDYYLYLHAYEPPASSRTRRGERIGLLNHHFTIPDMPNGRSDEPFELGELELEIVGGSIVIPSLAGKQLPSIKDLNMDFSLDEINNNLILVCFFDMQQRPSRRCITRLAAQAEKLKHQGVTVFAVQTSKIEEDELEDWVKENDIPFPVGTTQTDEKRTEFTWGVKSLPWLILTDAERTVRAEGFGLDELEEKILQAGGGKN